LKDPNSQNSTKPQTSNLPWHRRWLAKVWLAHGGGLYAVGYALTFLYLEARTIVEEIAESTGVIDFVTSQLIEFVFRFAIDSIKNMVQAFIWFVPVIQYHSPFGILLLAAGFYLFDIYLRKPVGDWLLRP
jgi:hypothetical protein